MQQELTVPTVPIPRQRAKRHFLRVWPRFTCATLLIALGCGLGVFSYQCKTRWTPLQRVYFPAYVRTAQLPLAHSGTRSPSHQFSLLVITYLHDARIALDSDVVRPSHTDSAHQQIAFTLSSSAIRNGARRLEWQRVRLEDPTLHAWLAHWIYDGRTPLADVQGWLVHDGLGPGLDPSPRRAK